MKQVAGTRLQTVLTGVHGFRDGLVVTAGTQTPAHGRVQLPIQYAPKAVAGHIFEPSINSDSHAARSPGFLGDEGTGRFVLANM
ncbi:MAG: hypothetical protein K0V04_37680 [Deltaproteobacteria bacterium]|nr:hypothetical protein [Deltaproteobacteria bacterium]